MTLIDRLIKDNQHDMYLNRSALAQMRAGRRTTTNAVDTTSQSITKLTMANSALRQANSVLRARLANAYRPQR